MLQINHATTILVILFACSAVWLIPYWRLCERTGMPKAIVWLGIIPVVGWLPLWIIAFADWREPR